MPMSSRWMLYGANGYTGRLVAELAVARGERPVLAGRDSAKVAAVAVPLGLEYRAFDLRDPSEVDAALRSVGVVAHCAGPFSTTSAAMVDGCLRAGAHYLDTTGEVDVFEAVFARSEDAERAGVVLLPGAGFDVVPADCLAAMVAVQLPTATSLDLAFLGNGGVSGGAVKSLVEGLAVGGRVRVDGELRAVPTGWRRRHVSFPSGTRQVSSLPSGQVSTVYRSTGIGTITTFTALPGIDRGGPRVAGVARRLFGNPVGRRLGKAVISMFVHGPGKHRRAHSWVEVFAEARDDHGRTATAALIGPNTYDITADAVLRVVAGLRTGEVMPGAHTSSTAFGADFVRRLHGIRVIEPSHR